MADSKTKMAAKTKAVNKVPTHPKYSDMVVSAITTLKERKGSSRQAILKHIIATYELDEKVAAVHLKVALRRGVEKGTLKQVKGVGASGSFKVEKVKAEPKKPKKAAVKKAENSKKVSKKVVKKSTDKKDKSVTKNAKKPSTKKVSDKKQKAKKPATKTPKTKKPADKAAPVKKSTAKKPATKKAPAKK